MLLDPPTVPDPGGRFVFPMIIRGSVPIGDLLLPRLPAILIISSSSSDLALVTCVLRRLYFRTYFITSKLTTLVTTQRRQPDLVLSSVRLPRMSNCNLVRRLQTSCSAQVVPIITIATLTDRNSHRGVLTTNFSNCVDGPFLVRPLRRLVRDFVNTPETVI